MSDEVKASIPLGVEEVKQAATAVAHLLNPLGAILQDGKVNVADAVSVPALFTGLKEIYDVKWGETGLEIVDMSVSEEADVAAHFKSVFNIPEDNVEAIIEGGFDLIQDALVAFAALRAVWEKVNGWLPKAS